jgi:threonine/homoserine/homoserine lactone efflux protein
MEGLLPFLLICLAVELTPGPNMAYLTLVSTLYGRKAGFYMVAGVASGLFLIGLAASLGAAAFIEKDSFSFYLLHWTGVLYFIYLAWDTWKERGNDSLNPENSSHFYRGFITNLLNPKAALFYLTVFPSFLDALKLAFSQNIALTVLYVLVATGVHSALVLMAAKAHNLIKKPEMYKTIRAVFTALLLLIALWLALNAF